MTTSEAGPTFSSAWTMEQIPTTTQELSTPTAQVAPSAKETFRVDVGAFSIEDSSQTEVLFRPNNISANVGDIVLFNMLGLSHSVTESSFERPCQYSGGFDTGLQHNPNNVSGILIQELAVWSPGPTWFYCKQQGHCARGMVFAINPASAQQMDDFIHNAQTSANSTNSTSPGISNHTTLAMLPESTQFLQTGPGTGLVNLSTWTGQSPIPSTAMGWNASTTHTLRKPPSPTSSSTPGTDFSPSTSNHTQGFQSNASVSRQLSSTIMFLGGAWLAVFAY